MEKGGQARRQEISRELGRMQRMDDALSAAGSQAVLIPCAHPLCSACLTGTLNIVGEKDIECCVCKIAVEDFKLVPTAPSQAAAKSSGVGADGDGNRGNVDEKKDKEGELLPSVFEFFEDVRARSSPPPTKVAADGGGAKRRENVVLRIDNVPWVCHIPFFLSSSRWLDTYPSYSTLLKHQYYINSRI
jgi:hypothetical protein